MPNHSTTAIPPDIESDLLPLPLLSVWEFASFELPRPSIPANNAGGGHRISDYFVTGPPKTTNVDEIRALFAPKDETVDKLHDHAKSLTNPHTAVQCLHLPSVESIGLVPYFVHCSKNSLNYCKSSAKYFERNYLKFRSTSSSCAAPAAAPWPF
ncbi:hypothetical protein B0H13DRAFT_1850938 [Mycena leptocephala]|nr:hypothetical protein B0H13DRAFT_1850938 [Mycena leptocephala]